RGDVQDLANHSSIDPAALEQARQDRLDRGRPIGVFGRLLEQRAQEPPFRGRRVVQQQMQPLQHVTGPVAAALRARQYVEYINFAARTSRNSRAATWGSLPCHS